MSIEAKIQSILAPWKTGLVTKQKDLQSVLREIDNLTKGTTTQEDFEKRLLATYAPLFDQVPSLTVLPVSIWGRYSKYESAGETFEPLDIADGSFEGLYSLLYGFQYEDATDDLVEALDAIVFDDEGDVYQAFEFPDILESEFEEFYDDGSSGGSALVIQKDENGVLEVAVIDCDDPS